ncbi:MAG: hypothetical protein QXF56_04615 [Candidatus Micrarchaeia archaeon]
MKAFHLLAFLLLFSIYVKAGVGDVNLFVYDYLNENETFTKTPFNLTDGEYYIINITGEPCFLVSIPHDGEVRMLTEREEIKNALLGYYETLGITSEDLKIDETYKNQLIQLVESYNSTRDNEYECRTYIGIDRFECVDYDTCWRACYTPVCQQVKIGAGKKFLDLIWDFSNLTFSIDSNISAFEEKLSSLSQLKNLSEVDELVQLIRNMKNKSIAVNNNEIFNPMAMGFCHVVDYNLTHLTQAEILLLTKRERVAPLLTVEETADELYKSTLERVQLKAQLIIDKLCSSLSANNSQLVYSFKMKVSGLNTSKMNEKVASLEQKGKLEGCSEMNETQIEAAELAFLTFLNETQNYRQELAEVINLRNEVSSSLSLMQGDFLLYFKLGEFDYRLNELDGKIDFAETSQLPNIKEKLLQLKEEMEEAENNKLLSFVTGFVASPFVLIVVILAILLLAKFIKSKK